MSKKWFIWTFVSALALLIAIQERVDVPNQEIVLHFENGDINSQEAIAALAAVKDQLEALEVLNILVSKDTENGILRIQYYSSEKVEVVKSIISHQSELALQHVFYAKDKNESIPLDKESNEYSISVFEIQTATDSGLEFNGTYVPEIKYTTEGHLDSHIFKFDNEISLSEPDGFWNTKIKVNTSVVLNLQKRSFKIPQVRAGPTS